MPRACQRSPLAPLSPLEPCGGKPGKAGNSAGTLERCTRRVREKGMPSRYKKKSRGDSYDASIRNLRKARARRKELGAYPRPFRSKEEQLMVRRLALWRWTCRDASRPSVCAWAKQLGVSHVWLLKLGRKFETDPGEVRRLQAHGDPTPEQLNRAREYTQKMRDRGELRGTGRRVPRAIEPAMEQFVRERFAQGWSKPRLARELFLDRRTVKRILRKV